MRCRVCGREPTRFVRFEQNIGLVVLRFGRVVEGDFCRDHIGSAFAETTLITLLFGWWGVISFFASFLIIPSNIREYWRARDLPRPATPAQPGAPGTRSPRRWLLPALGCGVLALGCLGTGAALVVSDAQPIENSQATPSSETPLAGGRPFTVSFTNTGGYGWVNVWADLEAVHVGELHGPIACGDGGTQVDVHDLYVHHAVASAPRIAGSERFAVLLRSFHVEPGQTVRCTGTILGVVSSSSRIYVTERHRILSDGLFR
jgi:hypothetical protein